MQEDWMIQFMYPDVGIGKGIRLVEGISVSMVSIYKQNEVTYQLSHLQQICFVELTKRTGLCPRYINNPVNQTQAGNGIW